MVTITPELEPPSPNYHTTPTGGRLSLDSAKCIAPLHVKPETVRNVLRKHKYHGRVPQRKPYMSKVNREARLAFAKMYVRQPTEY
ncbi:hypothetical protein TNCV_4300661 [Trichonephila clavipes]|nr:hypothetical protein TNCV_4300661 [Trichonephila clavipes]